MPVRSIALASLLVFASGARAQEPVPRCGGSDPEAAARALAEGDAAVDRAVRLVQRRRDAEARAAYEAAVQAYDQSCAAGADRALERRAIPLSRLGRPLDAIRSLDAFVAAHPLSSLPEEDRRRLESNLHALERDVGSLAVDSTPPGRVRVDGAEQGSTPTPVLRVAPDAHVRIEVTAEGHEPASREIDVGRGVVSRVELNLVPVAPARASPSGTGPSTGPSSAELPSGGGSTGSGAGPTLPPVAPSDDGLVPWAIVSTSGAVLLLVGAAVSTAWMVSIETGQFGSCLLAGAGATPACAGTISDHNTALGISIAGYVGAAALGTAAIVLWVMHGSHAPPPTSVTCGPGALGLGCTGTF